MMKPHRLQVSSPTGRTQETTVLLDGVELCCQEVELRASVLRPEHWTARLTVLVKPEVTIAGLDGNDVATVLLAGKAEGSPPVPGYTPPAGEEHTP